MFVLLCDYASTSTNGVTMKTHYVNIYEGEDQVTVYTSWEAAFEAYFDDTDNQHKYVCTLTDEVGAGSFQFTNAQIREHQDNIESDKRHYSRGRL